jgi:Na+/proline symporter
MLSAASAFGFVDQAIVVVYLGFIVWLGARYVRRQSDTAEYLLGGRQMPLWAVTVSVIAAEVSAATFLGLPALAYGDDLAYIVISIGFVLGRLILALYFLGVYRRLELFTVYGFLEQRFGPATKNAAAAVFLLGRLLASGVRLFIPTIAIQTITGLGLVESVLIVGLLGLVYTFLGGIRGVIWTEVVQAFTFVGGGIALIVFVVFKTEGGLNAAIDACTEADKFHIFVTTGSPWNEP